MKIKFNKETGRYGRFDNPSELIDVAVLEAAAANAPEGWLHHLVVTNVDSSQVIDDPKTKLRSVVARGSGVLKKHRVRDDAYFGQKDASFQIEFKEGYDDLGVPDIKIIKFKLNE